MGVRAGAYRPEAAWAHVWSVEGDARGSIADEGACGVEEACASALGTVARRVRTGEIVRFTLSTQVPLVSCALWCFAQAARACVALVWSLSSDSRTVEACPGW